MMPIFLGQNIVKVKAINERDINNRFVDLNTLNASIRQVILIYIKYFYIILDCQWTSIFYNKFDYKYFNNYFFEFFNLQRCSK